MKILHVKSLRTITLAAGICVLGFLLAYLSGGLIGEEPQNQPSASLPTVDLEVGSPSVPEESEENSETESEYANQSLDQFPLKICPYG